MTILSLVAMLMLFWAPAGEAAAPVKAGSGRGGFSVKFVGEGGGSPTTPELINDMENVAHPGGLGGSLGQRPGAPAPQETPKPAGVAAAGVSASPLTQAPAVGPTRPQPSASATPRLPGFNPEAAAGTAKDRRYSLWDGLAAPLELPSHKVKDISPDRALALGRRDYETHILSQRQGSFADAAGAVKPEASESPASGPDLFVAMNLDLKKSQSASLKDAVADLGRTAGFRQDNRFEPAAIGPGPDQVAIWGWMPARGLGEAVKLPSVARIEIKPSARRMERPDMAADVLIGWRVAGPAAATEALSGLERTLSIPGLRVKRSIGTQTAPRTGETVLVIEASVPIVALSRLMAHRDVVKMVPAPPTPPAQAGRGASDEIRRFLAFAMEHSPMLLAVTLLMLLPVVANWLFSATRIFVPYR